MEVIDLELSFSSILTSVVVGNLLIMALWLILSTNQGVRYVNINFIMVFVILIMIRLFLPFEYGFTNSIASKTVLPPISRLVFHYFAIGSGGFYAYQMLLLIWVTGFFVRLYQVVIQYYKVCKDIKYLPECHGIKSLLNEVLIKKKRYVDFKVVKISGLMTPVILGLWHPTIMIPENDYSQEELIYILRHETEHYYQHDLWIKAILEFLCAVYWWNPFCRIFKKQTSKALEMRTDSKVIGTMDERQRLRYLDCLLKVAKSHTKPMNNVALGFDGKKSNLKQRFCFILDYQVTKRKTLIIVNSIFAGIIIFLSTTIILEPYSIKPEDAAGTLIINEDNSFFVRNDEGYDWYVDNTYFVTINEINDDFLNLPVYESLENEEKK